ncbi:MAG: ligase-associated DNA damage response endonuclease PdeM [Rhodovibrionaceae bacterium]|nr:ligase-associated DNA damage response endonuclease PdeM [Rhodovibrionaceae bacterium]
MTTMHSANGLAGTQPTAKLCVNGAVLVADISGALYWPAQEALLVADLHLEKGSAYARWGQMLPPYDTCTTLNNLESVLARFRPRRLIALGDSFHDRTAAERVAPSERARIRSMTEALDWIWIAGNHDPEPPADWGGRVEPEITLGALVLRHEAIESHVAGEISGHYHPKASVRVRNKRISARCFIDDGRRLVLPAFGAYAGGLSVLDPALRGLFSREFQVHLLGRERLYRYPSHALVL